MVEQSTAVMLVSHALLVYLSSRTIFFQAFSFEKYGASNIHTNKKYISVFN